MATLNGKTALVTDGAHGIGRAASLALAAAGAQVLVHHKQSAAGAAETVSDIRQAGGKGEAIAASIADLDGAHNLARRARAIIGDRLDVLVLNSAPFEQEALETASAGDLDAQLARNIRAPLILVQQVLPILSKGSSIIFTLGECADADATPAYVSTRGALGALVPHLAAKLGERGVRVNAVTSGRSPEKRSKRGAPPLAERVSYDGLASAITFLASEGARSISGDTLSGQFTAP